MHYNTTTLFNTEQVSQAMLFDCPLKLPTCPWKFMTVYLFTVIYIAHFP